MPKIFGSESCSPKVRRQPIESSPAVGRFCMLPKNFRRSTPTAQSFRGFLYSCMKYKKCQKFLGQRVVRRKLDGSLLNLPQLWEDFACCPKIFGDQLPPPNLLGGFYIHV